VQITARQFVVVGGPLPNLPPVAVAQLGYVLPDIWIEQRTGHTSLALLKQRQLDFIAVGEFAGARKPVCPTPNLIDEPWHCLIPVTSGG
jgi:hypothetical protein